MRHHQLLFMLAALLGATWLGGAAYAESLAPWEEELPIAYSTSSARGHDAHHNAADAAHRSHHVNLAGSYDVRVSRRAGCETVVNVAELSPGDPNYIAPSSSDCAEQRAEVDATPERRLCGTRHRAMGPGHFLAIFYLIVLAWYAMGSLLMSALWPRRRKQRVRR